MVVVRTERVVAGGEALARDDGGRVVFVRGALPGETVDVAFRDERRQFVKADLVEVLEAGPDRVDEPCPRRAEGCGGCDWMHAAVPSQLGHKAAIVADALRRIGHRDDVEVELGGAVSPTGYRTTMRLVGDGNGRLGLHSHRSHDVVHTTGCLVAHPSLAQLIEVLGVTPGLEVTLRVSATTGQVMATWDASAGEIVGLPADAATGPKASIEEVVAGAPLRVSAGSFFQSGLQAAELLVATVRQAAPELATASAVVDAYAGIGVLARCLVDDGATSLLIESSRTAATDATRNCPRAHIHHGAVEKPAATVFVESFTDSVDVVMADPSRRGLGKGGVGAIARWMPGVVVLASCDAAAFGRDAALLAGHGYNLERVVAIDLFPHTHHVEAVSRFVRAAP